MTIMSKERWLKWKRAFKKKNTNKEDKRERLEDFSYNPNPYINARAIRHHINNEYGIKVMNKDVEHFTKGQSYTYYSDILRKDKHMELNDEEFEDAITYEDNRISGNVNGFVLKNVVNEAIDTKCMAYDTLFTRDKTKWNSSKLKTKQIKMDREMKEQNYFF